MGPMNCCYPVVLFVISIPWVRLIWHIWNCLGRVFMIVFDMNVVGIIRIFFLLWSTRFSLKSKFMKGDIFFLFMQVCILYSFISQVLDSTIHCSIVYNSDD